MKLYNNPVSRWWLSLDPTLQYTYWIIAFCAMLSVGIGLVVLVAETASMAFALPLLLGIGTFVLFFLFVVLWLTIRWPDIREQQNSDR